MYAALTRIMVVVVVVLVMRLMLLVVPALEGGSFRKTIPCRFMSSQVRTSGLYGLWEVGK
jgi:hypothetical protein